MKSGFLQGIFQQAAHVQFPEQDFLVGSDHLVLGLHLLVDPCQLVLDLDLTGTHLLHSLFQVVYFLLQLHNLVFLLIKDP